jgi:hypothetical protein
MQAAGLLSEQFGGLQLRSELSPTSRLSGRPRGTPLADGS